MDDPSETISLWHLSQALLGTMMAFLVWLGKRQLNRLDRLESHKADRTEVDSVEHKLDSMAKQNEERHRYVTDRLDRILDNITRK